MFIIIWYSINNKVYIVISIIIPIFLFLNNLKICLKVVKKNPNIVDIKNLGNLLIFSQKLFILSVNIIY